MYNYIFMIIYVTIYLCITIETDLAIRSNLVLKAESHWTKVGMPYPPIDSFQSADFHISKAQI